MLELRFLSYIFLRHILGSNVPTIDNILPKNTPRHGPNCKICTNYAGTCMFNIEGEGEYENDYEGGEKHEDI